MPRTKRAKKSASNVKGAPAPRRKAKTQRMGAASAVPYAASSGIRTKFQVASTVSGGSSCLRVHVVDQLASLTSMGASTGFIGDYIPFTLAEDAPALASLGTILPKLQGFAKISSRYQVRSARLHYQSVSAASREGNIGMALVPGSSGAISSIAELASFDHSAVVPVWQSASTSLWKNQEQRFYHTQASSSQELVPFTVVRLAAVAPSTGSEFANAAGLFWLELEIDFIDLRPMSQLGASFEVGTAQVVSGGVAANLNTVSWLKNTAMDGLWDWGKNKANSYFAPVGTSAVSMNPGAGVAVDALQTIEWFGDIILGAASVGEEKGRRPLLTWSDEKSDDLTEVRRPTTFPSHWIQPPRYRIICAFRTVAEAARAQSMGFDAEEVVRTLPNAAGDLAAYLLFQPEGGPTAPRVVLASWTISGGVGAIESKLQHSFAVGDTPGIAYLQLTPTGVENRTIDATSSMDFTSVNAVTSVAP